jgi:hypothetical protein
MWYMQNQNHELDVQNIQRMVNYPKEGATLLSQAELRWIDDEAVPGWDRMGRGLRWPDTQMQTVETQFTNINNKIAEASWKV